MRARNIFQTTRFFVGIIQGHPDGERTIFEGLELSGNVICIAMKTYNSLGTGIAAKCVVVVCQHDSSWRLPNDIILSDSDTVPTLQVGCHMGQPSIEHDGRD